MQTTMPQHLLALAIQAIALPVTSEALRRAREHIEAASKIAGPIEDLRTQLKVHTQTTRERLARVQLEIGRWSDASPATLREFAQQIAADVGALQPQVRRLADDAARHRAALGRDIGALNQLATHARVRIKQLDEERSRLNAKAEELRNRSALTWLFLPAKAIDELVSVFQHGKSTEAALQDAMTQLNDRRREASEHIRTEDVAKDQANVLDFMVSRLQSLVNQLALVEARLRSEESLAQFNNRATAGVLATTLAVLVQALDSQLA